MTPRFTANDLRWLLGWIVFALVIRGTVLWALAGMLERDTDGYAQLAENVANHHIYGFRDNEEIRPTAFRPPLYPLLLTTTVQDSKVARSRVAIWHAAMGSLTVVAVWWLGSLLGLRWERHLAALIVVVDPVLLVMSPQIMTETLATFLAVAALVLLACARNATKLAPMVWAVAGLLLGSAALCRPTFLLSTALVLLVLAILYGAKRQWLPVALVALGAAAPVGVWVVRNAQVMGRPIVATTHGGYTMLLANNPAFYDYLRSPKSDIFRAADLDRAMDTLRRENQWTELQYDHATGRMARENIVNDPAGFLRAATYRMTRLFGPAPLKTDPKESPRWQAARLGVTNWYIAVLGFAALGAIARIAAAISKRARSLSPNQTDGSEPLVWLTMLAFVASFAMLHLVYWCDLRMRAPLTPMIALSTAYGFAQIRQWLSAYRDHKLKLRAVGESDAVHSPQ